MFTHLHLHTVYSMLDGFIRPSQLADRLVELGMNAAAITDHGTMHGVYEFYKEFKKRGLKPIIGCEVYICRNRFEKTDENNARHHLILLAKNQKGYENLCELVSKGFMEGFHKKPRIDFELLKELHEGLICTSACIGGEIPRLFRSGDIAGAKEVAKQYKELFGDDFYLEIQDHDMLEEQAVKDFLILLGQTLNIKVIATNDAHYLRDSDAKTHDMLLCMQTGKTIQDTNRLRFPNGEFYVKSEAEMAEKFDQQYLDNTQEIVDKCQFEFVTGINHMPDFIPPDKMSAAEYLRKLSNDGLRERYPVITEELQKRLDYELDVIIRMGFDTYFLTVWDFINYSKRNGIAVGPGRGSGAGSLVAYALKITNLDPIDLGLIFERFLNPDRVSMPDFDIDFCSERRTETIDYVRNKYGKNHVVQITTFGTMAARSAVRAVGRVYEVPLPEVDRVCKMIPSAPGTRLSDAIIMSPDLQKEYEDEKSVARFLIDSALQVEGLPSHTSTHAAGVVITPEPVYRYAPLIVAEDKTTKEKVLAVQFPMTQIEDLGLIKFDFLGLRNLTVMDKTSQIVKEKTGIDLDIDNLSFLENPEIYKKLFNADTFGVFQLESGGITSLVAQMYEDVDKKLEEVKFIEDEVKREEASKKLAHELFERWIAAISLYRPGPMEYIPEFLQNMRNPDNIVYDHPLLEDILKNTYNVIVYQEQVMQIVQVLAGFTLAQSDNLRKVISKKKSQEEMDKQRDMFFEGCSKNGISSTIAERVWGKMEDFVKYAFNKSHAACYAYIGFQTLYQKYFWNVEFLASLLSSVINSSDKDKLKRYCNLVMKKYRIPLLPPEINVSVTTFNPSEGSIYFGLNGLKGVGTQISNDILYERSQNGNFVSFFDFCKRMKPYGMSKRVMEPLIKSGAFDFLGKNRLELLLAMEEYLDAAKYYMKPNRANLLSMVGLSDLMEPTIQEVEMPERMIMEFEKDSLQIYLSKHPLDDYQSFIKDERLDSIEKIQRSIEENDGFYNDGEYVIIPAVFSTIETKITKNNTKMAITKIDDGSSEIEMIVFSKVFEQSGEYVVENGMPLLIKARINIKDEGALQLTCSDIISMPIPDFAAIKQRMKEKRFYIKDRSEPVKKVVEKKEVAKSKGQKVTNQRLLEVFVETRLEAFRFLDIIKEQGSRSTVSTLHVKEINSAFSGPQLNFDLTHSFIRRFRKEIPNGKLVFREEN